MAKISYDEVHELFNYDPETGIFINKINRRIAKKGEVAGCLNGDGYWQVCVKGKQYKAHRLAWLYVHGYFPENQIDHINRNPGDNRIVNLREASRSCNLKNCKLHSDNTSGIAGVYWYKRAKKWQGSIQDKNHKRVHIGMFTSKLEAAKARYAAEIKYEYPNCNTQSSALEYIKSYERR